MKLIKSHFFVGRLAGSSLLVPVLVPLPISCIHTAGLQRASDFPLNHSIRLVLLR